MKKFRRNQPPVAPGMETFKHPGIVRYEDGETAALFETLDDVLQFGPNSLFKYARNLGPSGNQMAIIRTTSNTYGFGAGLVVSARDGKAIRLPENIPDITIGQRWEIPGQGSTTPVEQVLFRHKLSGGDYGGVQVDSPSPFPALARTLEKAQEQMPPPDVGRIALLPHL